MTWRAIWRDAVLAESNEIVEVEGNHYFPAESLREEYFIPSGRRTLCPWKGVASYRSVSVDDEVEPDAAWEYTRPWILARRLKNHVAFGRCVEVVRVGSTDEGPG